jgi:hypothetical protein
MNLPIGTEEDRVAAPPSGEHYRIEVDRVTIDRWSEILTSFDDANIWQTWTYGAVRWREDQLSHIVLLHNETPVAAAQVAVVRVPWLNRGIAYVKWGPMCRPKGGAFNVADYRRIIRALRQEYVGRRNLLLRLLPRVADDDCGLFTRSLHQEGYRKHQREPPFGTFLIDLTANTDDLYQGLKGRWRRNLLSAKRNDLEIAEETSAQGLQTFLSIYNEMQSLKPFSDPMEVWLFPRLFEKLPVEQKPRILICRNEGEPVAGRIVSLIGDTAIYLFGAAGNRGRSLMASYAIDWWLIEWLKQNNMGGYDLGGAGAKLVNQYKTGFVGRNGRKVNFPGKFEAGDLANKLIVSAGERLSQLLSRDGRPGRSVHIPEAR